MSELTGVDRELLMLEQVYNQELTCHISYNVCTIFDVAWRGNGSCPGCSTSRTIRLFCNACATAIRNDAPMHCPSCNYRGKGKEFFPVLDRL